jgi:flagellar biosynthesis protein FliR
MDDDVSYIIQDVPPNNHSWYKLWWLLVFLIISLFIGIAGYYYFANLAFVDSLLNASMILGGMGPVDILPNNSAKVFASFYALYSGMVFLVIVAFIIDSIV